MSPWTITHQASLSMEFSRQEHWLLLCCVIRSVVSDSLQPHGLESSRLLCPWESPGKNTGMSCYFLLQRVFPTQGWNLCLLHDRQILLLLSQQGSPNACQLSVLILVINRYSANPVVCQTLLATVTRADPRNGPRLYEVSLWWERQRGLVLPNSGRVHSTDHSAYGIPCTCATQQPRKKDSKQGGQ